MLSDILVMYDDVFGEERVFLENNYLLFVQIRWYIAWFIKSAMWTGRDLPLNLHSSRLWYPGNFWKINVGGVGMPSGEAASIKIFQMFHGRWRWGVVDDGDWHLALKDLQGDGGSFFFEVDWSFFPFDFDRTWPIGCNFFNDFDRMLQWQAAWTWSLFDRPNGCTFRQGSSFQSAVAHCSKLSDGIG